MFSNYKKRFFSGGFNKPFKSATALFVFLQVFSLSAGYTATPLSAADNFKTKNAPVDYASDFTRGTHAAARVSTNADNLSQIFQITDRYEHSSTVRPQQNLSADSLALNDLPGLLEEKFSEDETEVFTSEPRGSAQKADTNSLYSPYSSYSKPVSSSQFLYLLYCRLTFYN